MGEFAGSQPFFLYLHVIDPHAPYAPPAPFDTRFPKSPALPAKMSIGQYDGEVAFVDSQFGRVLDSPRTHGLDQDTMTIFVADHGEELLDHGSFGHGAILFEEVARVPLVIRFPNGAHAGTRVGAAKRFRSPSRPPTTRGPSVTRENFWATRVRRRSARWRGPTSE